MVTPLVPADVDLRDFAFMPLEVARLRDSSLSAKATGDEFRAAVLLWCASWHQVPAGSLPDDDADLATYAGYGRVVREWKRVRAGAMRGWVKCDDGRFYHPTVAEKALEAWAERLLFRWRKECDRLRKENKSRQERGLSPLEIPEKPRETPVVSNGNPNETTLKGREGKGQGESFLQTSFSEKASGGTIELVAPAAACLDLEDLGRRCRDAVGAPDDLADLDQIVSLIERDGFDFEGQILPAMRRAAAKRAKKPRGDPVVSYAWFIPAIREQRPAVNGGVHAPKKTFVIEGTTEWFTRLEGRKSPPTIVVDGKTGWWFTTDSEARP